MLDPNSDTLTCKEFEAEIFLLFHTTQISKRFQATVHIGNVIQTAVVVSMNRVSKNFSFQCKQNRPHIFYFIVSIICMTNFPSGIFRLFMYPFLTSFRLKISKDKKLQRTNIFADKIFYIKF